MKAKLLVSVFSLFWIFTAVPSGAAVDTLKVPALSGPVVDEVGILNSNDKLRLESLLMQFHQDGKVQMAILIPNSLQGLDIEGYAVKVFETWKLGTKGKDQGLLLVVATKERKMRLEVGYGLEGDITDFYSRQILDNTLRPYFREQRYGDGLLVAVEEIGKKLGVNLAAPVEDRIHSQVHSNRPQKPLRGYVTLFLLLAFLFLFLLTTPFRGRRGSYWGGGGFGGGGGGWGGGGGFSGGGGSSGGGGASSSW